MAESYSVQAVLSAKDDGFTSTFKNAMSATESLGSKVKSGLGFGVLAGIGQQAFSTITSSVGGLISELDSSNSAWKVFTKNMEMTGSSSKEISSVKSELQDFAQQTIYSASDMASTYSQLAAVGTKNTTALVKGFGGLAAAAIEPKQAMKTLSQQATQMAAKPMVQWQDFKLMMEQTPAGVASVAKQMNMSTSELVASVQDGKIATEDFFDAVAKVGTNDSFTQLATQYKTVGEAMDGLVETISNTLQPAFDVLSQVGINAVSGITDAMEGIDASSIATKIQEFVNTASKYWEIFKDDMVQVGSAFSDAISAISEDFQALTGSFGSTESLSSFSGVMDTVTGALEAFAGFCEEHSETIAILISQLPKLAVGFAAFKIVSVIAPFMQIFGNAIGGLAKIGLEAIATKLFGLATSETAAGTASGAAGKEMLIMSGAMLGIGAGVALAAVGIALMAQSAIALANAGTGAVVAMVGITAGIVGLMAVASLLGPALVVGAAGVALLGAGLLLVATSAVVAGAAVKIVASALPTIATYGVSGAVGLATFAASMIAFGAGAAVAGAAAIVLGAGLAVAAAGLAVFGAGAVVAAAGTAIMAAALKLVNSSMKSISSNAKSAQSSLSSMQSSVSAVSSGLQAIGDKANSAMSALKSAFSKAVNNVKTAGTNVGKGFVSGFQTSIKKADTVASSAVKSVGNKLKSGRSAAQSAGQYISQGFAVGMESCLDRIQAAAAKMVAAADKAIKAKGQIHSPSKLTAKSGKFLAQGLAVGMAQGITDIKNASKSLISAATSAMKGATVTRDYTGAADSATSAYKSALESKKNSISKTASSTVDAAIKAATKKTKNKTLKKNLKTVGTTLKNQMTKYIEQASDKAIEAAESAMNALAEVYQDKYNEIANDRSAYLSKLQDYGSLYSVDSYGFITFTDFSEQTKKVKQLESNLEKLKDVLPYDLMMDIQQLDTTAGLQYTNELLKKSGEYLTNYGNQYTEMMNTAQNASQNYYKSYVDKLDNEYNAAITTEMKKLEAQLNTIGQQAAQGLINGLSSKTVTKQLKKVAKNLANTLVKTFKKKLGIHSPSRVFIGLAEYIGAGVVKGVDSMQRDVSAAMNSLLTVPDVSIPALAGGFSGELSSDYDYYRNANYTIYTTVEMDGREVAKATAPYTEEELNKRQTRSNRRSGIR